MPAAAKKKASAKRTSPKRASPKREGSKRTSAKRASRKPAQQARPAKSTAEPATEVPPIFRLVVDAFADARGVSRRRMFSSEHTFSVNGKIFAMLVRGALVVKLPKERVDALVEAGEGERFDPGQGRLMREWLVVEAGGLPWVALAKEAHQFVRRSKRG
jgi:hypothetical protein